MSANTSYIQTIHTSLCTYDVRENGEHEVKFERKMREFNFWERMRFVCMPQEALGVSVGRPF